MQGRREVLREGRDRREGVAAEAERLQLVENLKTYLIDFRIPIFLQCSFSFHGIVHYIPLKLSGQDIMGNYIPVLNPMSRDIFLTKIFFQARDWSSAARDH